MEKLKAIQDTLDKEGTYFQKDERKGKKDLSYLIQVEKAGSFGYVVVRKSIPGIQKNMMLMDLFYVLSSLVTLAAGSVILCGWQVNGTAIGEYESGHTKNCAA